MPLDALLKELGPQRAGLAARLATAYRELPATAPDPITVPFGEWRPDLPDFGNPGAIVANGVIPDAMSYRPFRQLRALSSTSMLDSRALGAIAVRDTAGNNFNYAGDAGKLYVVASGQVTDKSKAGGYSTAPREVWEATTFGNRLIFTNYADPVQGLDIGGAGLFADQITSTNKPQARHIATVREFVVLGNTVDSADGVRPGRIWWSAFNDPTNFDPNAATQCGFVDKGEGGWVQRIVGGKSYGLVFQQTQIVRMTYVGPPKIWDINDEIDRKRGTPIPNSVIGYGRDVYFIADDGFGRNDGTQTYMIGQNKVDRTFWNQFDANNAHLVSSAIDPVNKLVAWAAPGSGSTTIPNKIWFYNWEDNRFSDVDVDLDLLINATSEALTLEDFDALTLDPAADTTLSSPLTGGETVIPVVDVMDFRAGNHVRITLDSGAIHQSPITDVQTGQLTITTGVPSAAAAGNRAVRTSIDVFTNVSLDSPQWQGGRFFFGAYDPGHRQAYFDGPNMRANIVTQERQLFDGRVATVGKARPLIQTGGAVNTGEITCVLASRNRLIDPFTFTTPQPIDSIGEVGFLANGGQQQARYHRIQTTIPKDYTWTHALGMQFIASPGGKV